MIGTILARLLRKAAVRGALVLAPALAPHEVLLVDMRGKLPTDGVYPYREMWRVNAVVIHHSATTGQPIRSIAEFHVAEKGWPGIAYHRVIDKFGTVFICNDYNRRTNHAAGFNTRSIGLCLLGNYQKEYIEPPMLESFNWQMDDIQEKYGISDVYFHRDTKRTDCPGQHAVDVLTPLYKRPNG